MAHTPDRPDALWTRFVGQRFNNNKGLQSGLQDILAVVFGLVVFALGMHGERYAVVNEGLAVAIYAFLYSATLLLAYRLRAGVYTGLGQIAIVATYISLGGTATVIAALSGALLAEVGRALLYKPLNASRRSLQRALATAFFTSGTGALAVILGGAVYTRIGGAIPLVEASSGDIFPLGVLFVLSFLLHLALILGMYRIHHPHARWRTYRALIRGLIVAELLPLPLSFLLAVVFHSLNLLTFFTLLLIPIFGAALYRVSEVARYTLEQRVAELALINEFGQSLSANLSINELLSSLHRQIGQMVDVEMFVVTVYDPSHDTMIFPYVSDRGHLLQWPQAEPHSLSHYIGTSRQMLLLRGNVQEKAAKLGIETIRPPIPVCFLGIPLIAADQVIGTLSVESFSDPEAYDEADAALLMRIAPQAAIALKNAELFSRVAGMAGELSQLSDISSAISTTLDLDVVLQRVCQALTRVSGSEKAAIFLRSEENSTALKLAVSTGLSADYVTLFDSFLVEDDSATMQVMRQTEPLAISDMQTDPRALGWRSLAEMEGYRALAVIPLRARGEPIGFLAVYHNQVHIFQPAELSLLSTFANQVSVAVANARLFHEAQQRAEDMAGLVAATRALVESLELERIGAILIRQLQHALSLDEVTLLLWEDSYGQLRPLNIFSSSTPDTALLDYPLFKRAVREQRALTLPITLEDQALLDVRHLKMTVALPLTLRSETAGLVLLGRMQPLPISARERQFADALLNQAATVLDNARLFSLIDTQLDERIGQLSAIESVSRKISASLDLPTVLKEVISAALAMTYADIASCGLQDSSGDLIFNGYEGILWWEDARLAASAGITARVMRTGQLALVADLRQDPDYRAMIPDMLSELCVPILRSGVAIGVLNVESKRLDAFTPVHVSFLTTLADHAAIAIEKARLFADTQRGSEQMRAILNSTRDGMVLIGLRGELIRVNPAAERILNERLHDLIGQNVIRWLRRSLKRSTSNIQYSTETLRTVARSLKQNPHQLTRHVYQVLSEDNSVRDVEEIGLPVQDESGSVIARLFILRDISEEKSLERFRDQVTSMIIHDLRSPLASIVTSLSMIEDFALTGDLAGITEVQRIASNSASSLILMVESILEIRRMENGLLALEQTIIPLSLVATGAMQVLEATAADAYIRFVNRLPPMLPILYIDMEKIRRVLINLLDNAIKHTPTGHEVRIEASHMPGEPMVTVRIVDTGRGIPLEFREEIFNTFVTLPNSALRGRRGIGLGLTFCKLTIEAHGGKIWVESGPEGGAAMCFTLPVAGGSSFANFPNADRFSSIE